MSLRSAKGTKQRFCEVMRRDMHRRPFWIPWLRGLRLSEYSNTSDSSHEGL